MKVCAWANLSPYQHVHKRFDSQAAGLKWFREYGRDVGWSNHGDPACIDFYPVCKDCQDGMNFHDYPMVRFEVGPRGGIRKVCV